ncbi:MAG: hypothetical protein GQ532_08985 [Methylomarinum sp.]|nr:hypothetical protein [Methylomarinum sp.]
MSKKTYKVLSPLKHNGDQLKAGDPVGLTDKQAQPLLSAKVVEEVVTVENPVSLTELIDAIAQLEPGNEDHWTKDGKPEVKALSAILRRKVSAAERDNAELIAQFSNS